MRGPGAGLLLFDGSLSDGSAVVPIDLLQEEPRRARSQAIVRHLVPHLANAGIRVNQRWQALAKVAIGIQQILELSDVERDKISSNLTEVLEKSRKM